LAPGAQAAFSVMQLAVSILCGEPEIYANNSSAAKPAVAQISRQFLPLLCRLPQHPQREGGIHIAAINQGGNI